MTVLFGALFWGSKVLREWQSRYIFLVFIKVHNCNMMFVYFFFLSNQEGFNAKIARRGRKDSWGLLKLFLHCASSMPYIKHLHSATDFHSCMRDTMYLYTFLTIKWILQILHFLEDSMILIIFPWEQNLVSLIFCMIESCIDCPLYIIMGCNVINIRVK